MAWMTTVAPGMSWVDLHFLGRPGVIATGVLEGAAGLALVDPGPSTTLPALEAALAARGRSFDDVRAILLTHIHLDHAGAAGTLCGRCPDARVWVHERGAPHMADPSKLLASAGRLYGDDMDRLWGRVDPVPADRLEVLSVGGEGQPAELERVAAGHELRIAWTPGHASHHVSYFLPGARLAFVGDTAGLRRQDTDVVLPASPPPDIDLEAWRASTDRILAWEPHTLFLTHFGPYGSPGSHFASLWRGLDDWSARVRATLAGDHDPAEAAAAFRRDVEHDLEARVGAVEAEAYAAAGRFDYSWTGLARYWRRAGQHPLR